ncbi:MAG: hypothetical protein V3S62_03290 [Acidimicrobiia bacterium]
MSVGGCRRLSNHLASLGGAIHEWGNPVRIARRVGDRPGADDGCRRTQ